MLNGSVSSGRIIRDEELTEGIGEVDVIDIDECDCTPSCGLVPSQAAISAEESADNHQRDAGAGGAGHQKRAATDLVDEEECR